MARTVKYYGFYFHHEGYWVVEAVMSEGRAQWIDVSFRKDQAVARCAALNAKLASKGNG